MIVHQLIKAVSDKASKCKLEDLRIGLGYTGVILSDGSCGVAYTFRGELNRNASCSHLYAAGSLRGVDCISLLNWLSSADLLSSVIGTAVLNALLQDSITDWPEGNCIEDIQIPAGGTVGMVGHFKPVVGRIKKRSARMMVFERDVWQEEDVYPDWAAELYLPECDTVIITGTTISNKTIDRILEKSHKANEIVIVGPTTPLCVEVFKETGVTMLAGVRVEWPQEALRIISEGGGAADLSGVVARVYRRL